MASKEMIHAINESLTHLYEKRRREEGLMNENRRESIFRYSLYKKSKSEYIAIIKSIEELKKDLRRINNENH